MDSQPFTPEERSLRARMAAHAMHAQNDSRETSRPAREASPYSVSFFERKVDPDGELPAAERTRRAEQARKEHFVRMAYRSARVRRAKKRGDAG